LKIQVIAEPSESDRICKPSPYALKYIPLSSRTDAVEHKIGQSDPVEIRLECEAMNPPKSNGGSPLLR